MLFFNAVFSLIHVIIKLTRPHITPQEPKEGSLTTHYIIRMNCSPLWAHIKQFRFIHIKLNLNASANNL